MKYSILLLLLFTAFKVVGQNKVRYSAKEIIMYAYCPDGEKKYKKAGEKVIGINVRIVVDTIFNKYSVLFKDEDGVEVQWSLKFIQKQTEGGGTKRNQINYFRVENEGKYFELEDYMETRVALLRIKSEDKMSNGCDAIFDIKDISKD